ncbi:hypothetical protein KKG31_05935 [Patescibacteria group bacterium]|nr:hypothetical protein [Patescibacteria group bacterium]MBU1758642.1 hypothetical protein [Patescibacteria group bacterium]
MDKFLKKLQDIWDNPSIRKKIIFTIMILAIYRLLVFIPVPFVDISVLMSQTLDAGSS